MNEKIKQFSEQARKISYFLDGGYTPVYATDLEKFAELIVRECIKMVENEAAQYVEPVWAFELVNDMKDRFGVVE